jgi:Cleft lip and palate transmembrane protein 1 (CLPTM1)
MASMDYGFKQQQENPGPLGQTSSGAEIDEFKRMLIDTNPILLGTTLIVYLISCSSLSSGFDVA